MTKQALHELRVGDTGFNFCTCNPGCELFPFQGDVTASILGFQEHINAVKNQVSHDQFTMWAPRPNDLEWMRNTLDLIRQGGIWGIPACRATLEVDREDKALRVMEDNGDDPVLLARTATISRMIGWKFEEKQ